MTDVIDTTADEPTPSLFAKLAAITAEIGHVEARGMNDFLKTKYVTEEDIIDAVREKLTDRNICVLPSMGTIGERGAKTAKGKDTTITTARIAFTFCDGDTGQTYTCEWAGQGEDGSDKGLTKAGTSALRTFLLKTFFVVAGDDGPGQQPSAPPRRDGAAPISPEQYQGIVEAFKAAGGPETELHVILDGFDIPREDNGTPLAVAHRVARLSGPAAISVHKKLASLNTKSPEGRS